MFEALDRPGLQARRGRQAAAGPRHGPALAGGAGGGLDHDYNHGMGSPTPAGGLYLTVEIKVLAEFWQTEEDVSDLNQPDPRYFSAGTL